MHGSEESESVEQDTGNAGRNQPESILAQAGPDFDVSLETGDLTLETTVEINSEEDDLSDDITSTVAPNIPARHFPGGQPTPLPTSVELLKSGPESQHLASSVYKLQSDTKPEFPTAVQFTTEDPSTDVTTSASPISTRATSVASASSHGDMEQTRKSPTSLSPSTRNAFVHRPTKSTGPSALEKVVSKTRPSFLPPKSREEDRKHMAVWEEMMKQSRSAEQKRRIALSERQRARERAIEDSIRIWEKEIIPDWTCVLKDPQLRKLWWQGIPPKHRAVMWEHAVGNPLELSKDTYRACLARAKRAMKENKFPTTTLHLIEQDIASTLPSLHLFTPATGPLYTDLEDMLCAWVVARSDEGLGYVMGASKVAAMFLLNMTPQSAFIAMRGLLERHCLRSFYGGLSAKQEVEAYYRIFDTLLADRIPKVYFNFKQHQVSPALYLPDWLMSVFLVHLPLDACARLWDVLLLEGDSFLYRAALAILLALEPRLFFPDRQELLDLLQGEDKAALAIAQREGHTLDGAKYEIYSVNEEVLWDRIEEIQELWKESTWSRLIQRELPDV